MVEILASSIVILGNSSGVWSPSHPQMFPPPVISPQVGVPAVIHTEERYVPETPLTDDNGNPIIF